MQFSESLNEPSWTVPIASAEPVFLVCVTSNCDTRGPTLILAETRSNCSNEWTAETSQPNTITESIRPESSVQIRRGPTGLRIRVTCGREASDPKGGGSSWVVRTN